MSTKGIYSALSGAIAQSQKLDTIANNIANVNTPAFKRDQQIFNEYLTANEKEPSVMQVPRIPASIDSFYDMQGADKSFVDTKGTFTDFSQGSLKNTGNPLDVAIDGKGFFEVATPSGVKFTRNGSFTLDGQGQLVTKEGYPVLKNSPPGTPPEARVLRVNGTGLGLSINDQGEVIEGADSIGQLSLINVAEADSLMKAGGSLYDFRNGKNPEITNVQYPSLKQGFLEMSNINIVKEMTDMISAHRVFESTQKAIQAYDRMSEKITNVVGKTTP